MRRTRSADDPVKRDAEAEGAGRNPAEYAIGAQGRPWVKGSSDPQGEDLLARVVEPENMKRAWKQVKRNKGAAGIDGRDLEETMAFLRIHWPEIRQQLLEETYTP